MTPPGRELQSFVAQAIGTELGARGWSRRGLAARAGLNERTLMRVMTCTREMTLQQLDRIAQALDVSPVYLLTEAHRRSAGIPSRGPR